jgi:GAF domain-containing protein
MLHSAVPKTLSFWGLRFLLYPFLAYLVVMKFLRDKKLKHLGAYLLLLTVFIFVVQYFILGQKIRKLEEAQLKQEYTRIVQLANQQISLNVQDYLNGNKNLTAQIAALLGEQEHRLRILAAGGRVEQSEDFIGPLNRLPRITFEGLKEDWQIYKQSVYSILNDKVVQPQLSSAPADSLADSGKAASLVSAAVVVNNPTNSATIKYQGLALSMGKWYDRLMTDLEEEVQSEKTSLTSLRTTMTILNIVFFGGLYSLFFIYVLKPLASLKENISSHRHSEDFPANEIGELAINANNTIEQLKDAADFVMAIGKGDLSINYREALDNNYVHGQNRLADSLIEMQAKLKQLNEEEQKRQWANEGLARFVDILRSSNDNIHILGDKVISGLVQYTRANQGALYILNDEEESNNMLELISLFAFDIKKHEQQRIKPGQGILGQTFLEKETTYLTALPDEYVRITSGLGGATPKSILIVPLKVDKDVYGLVELASFNEFQPHEIAFVEKLGESIASTLASVRAAQKNKNLIEQFQQQTEQMKAQEEEMRQNMEELQATQEEVVRKERTYISRIAELEKELSSVGANRTDDKVVHALNQKEQEYKRKIDQLEKELEQANTKGEGWEIAGELVKNLRVNLESIRITEEELKAARKASEGNG